MYFNQTAEAVNEEDRFEKVQIYPFLKVLLI